MLLIITQVSAITPTTVSSNNFSLTFVTQTNQNVNGTSCYNAQILIRMLYNGTGTKNINVGNFWLYQSGQSLTISNSTYSAHPSNNLRSIPLFPNNQIQMILYFTNFCIIQGATKIFLFYYDGTVQMQLQII